MTELEILSVLATGRKESLFKVDLAAASVTLEQRVRGQRFLVIGGAGSIGSATTKLLAHYRPKALHVVDQSENALAELVRDLRSSQENFEVEDFKAWPLDFGAPVMGALLRSEARYDCILNFAALKHVRSEKDSFSLVQMLDTNLAKPERLLQWLASSGRCPARFFCVSTDKAADPVNLMGASKRLMEHWLFLRCGGTKPSTFATTARFANVAFSEGSLLDGMLRRLRKRQPLAVPEGCSRYFVSLRESGEICLLSALLGPGRHIIVPKLNEAQDQVSLQTIAERVLNHFGRRARFYREEQEARRRVDDDEQEGFYPVLLTPLDTSGEKTTEKFLAIDQRWKELRFEQLAGIAYAGGDPQALDAFMRRLNCLVSGERFASKQEIVSWISEVIPEFRHTETFKSLDARM